MHEENKNMLKESLYESISVAPTRRNVSFVPNGFRDRFDMLCSLKRDSQRCNSFIGRLNPNA